jgi:hypothetical protein
MKVLAFSILVAFSALASAQDEPPVSEAPSPSEPAIISDSRAGGEIYKVESVTTEQDPQNVDGLVKSTMLYMDRSGRTHCLVYQIMGYGGQNG